VTAGPGPSRDDSAAVVGDGETLRRGGCGVLLGMGKGRSAWTRACVAAAGATADVGEQSARPSSASITGRRRRTRRVQQRGAACRPHGRGRRVGLTEGGGVSASRRGAGCLTEGGCVSASTPGHSDTDAGGRCGPVLHGVRCGCSSGL
jgi:hypothetical protein